MTKVNEYIPTAAEKRILEVALDPTSFSMNVEERCKAAKTSKVTWYKAMAKKPFTDLINTLTMDMLKGKVANVVNATYNFATTDSKCASDRKILLTMAGLYTEKKDIELIGAIKVNDPFKDLTTEELKKLANNN